MGCGSSSPKPAKQNQKNPLTSTAGAADPNASADHNRGETSNSQINVQIDQKAAETNAPNGEQGVQNGDGSAGVNDKGEGVTTDQKDQNGEIQTTGNNQSRNSNAGNPSTLSPRNQNSSNKDTGGKSPRGGGTQGRANTTQGFASRNSRQAGTAPSRGYPSPRANGQFQNSRSKTVPGRGRQQQQHHVSDEMLNDPAYRRKVLADTSERLKTKESQSPREDKNDENQNSSDHHDGDYDGKNEDDNRQYNNQGHGNVSNRSDRNEQGSHGNQADMDETNITGIIWDPNGTAVGLVTDSTYDAQVVSQISEGTTHLDNIVNMSMLLQDSSNKSPGTTEVRNADETNDSNLCGKSEISNDTLDGASVLTAAESMDIVDNQSVSTEENSPKVPVVVNFDYVNTGHNIQSNWDSQSGGLIAPFGIVKELTRDIMRTKSEQKNHTDVDIETVMVGTRTSGSGKGQILCDSREVTMATTESFVIKDKTDLREGNLAITTEDRDLDVTKSETEDSRIDNSSCVDKDIPIETLDSDVRTSGKDSKTESALKQATSIVALTDDGEDDRNDCGEASDDRVDKDNEEEDVLKVAQIDAGIQLTESPGSQRSNSQRENPSRNRHAKQRKYVPYYGDPNERAKAKRIRFMLREAMINNDLDELDEAIYLFETNDMVDLGDLTDAINRLEILQLKKDLKEAIERRNLGILNRAIGDTYSTKHDKDLRHLLNRAEELRDHLEALNHCGHDILQMDHNLISEIRSYCSPPPSVHEVMAACYMLLGIREERLLEWAEVQAHVGRTGRTGLKQMIQNFDPERVPVQTVLRVKEILNFYNLEDVRVASNGAASFYIWVKNMVDLVDKRRLQNTREDQERSKSSAQKG